MSKFHSNPHDLVMHQAMNMLHTRNPMEVSTEFHQSLRQQLLLDTKATRKELFQAIRDYPPIYPPPTPYVVAMTAFICRNWRSMTTVSPVLFGTRGT